MGEKQSVLVIDDEPKIRELLKSYLEMNGYTALCAADGETGLAIFAERSVSLILLDLMLPGLSGEEICQRIRRVSEVPIIMITARADEDSIIRLLRLGADDYVCKPFSPRQLMARVEAALRRSGGNTGGGGAGGLLACKDLTVDRENRIARLGGETLNLTRDEYRILALLMSRQAKIFTREEILNAVKGDGFDGFDRSVDSLVKRLRAKIGDSPKNPRYIITVYGMGYRLGEPG